MLDHQKCEIKQRERELDKGYIRNQRIQTLTKMALNGATLEQLRSHASHWASKKTVDGYIDEVINRLNKIKK